MKCKVWHIQTWGAGTPHYLVAAETQERAWELVERAWRTTYDSWYVGSYRSHDSTYKYQSVHDLMLIPGLTAEKETLVDLLKNKVDPYKE